MVIAAPSIHLARCKAGFKSDIATASQDVSVRSGFGAYTGELSAQLLVDSGINWALTGHSERRDGFNAPVRIIFGFFFLTVTVVGRK